MTYRQLFAHQSVHQAVTIGAEKLHICQGCSPALAHLPDLESKVVDLETCDSDFTSKGFHRIETASLTCEST